MKEQIHNTHKRSKKLFLAGFALLALLGLGFFNVSAIEKAVQQQREISLPIPFLGPLSDNVIDRIGSLSIGFDEPGSWLNKKNAGNFNKSCINKWNTGKKAGSNGSETCLDISGGAIFDSLFVHQATYLNGRAIFNTKPLVGETSALVVGNETQSQNSILALGLADSESVDLRSLCATDLGEIYPCNAVPTELSPVYEYRFDECEFDPNIPIGGIVPENIASKDAKVKWSTGTVDAIGRAINLGNEGRIHTAYDYDTGGGKIKRWHADQYGVFLPASTQLSENFSFTGWYRTDDTHENDPVYNLASHPSPSNDHWGVNNAGYYGQKWAVNAEETTNTTSSKAALSYGVNGVSLYEIGKNSPARIVHASNLGTGWNHVVVSYDDNVPSLYVNGQLVGTAKRGPALSNEQISSQAGLDKIIYSPTQLGHSSRGYFQGQIDEFKIYNHPLTARQVGEVYTSENGSTRANSCESTEYYWGYTGWWCSGYEDILVRTPECRFKVGNREYNTNDQQCLDSVGPKGDRDTGDNPCIPITYDWKIYGWELCKNGIDDVRYVTCNDSKGSTNVGDDKCLLKEDKPVSFRKGNCGGPTGYNWHKKSDWGACQADGRKYQNVECDSEGVHNVGNEKCNPDTKPSNSIGCDVPPPPPGSCSGTYNVATGGSCSGEFSTTGQECSGGTFTYLRETGQYPDVDQAQSACAAQGLGIHACQSGYNCSNNIYCPEQDKTASCSSLNINACGKDESRDECSVTTIPASCGGGNYTYQVETGIYADSTTALNACGEDLGLHGCDSGYNCADNTYCPLKDRSGSCSGKSETSCGSSAEFGAGTCSWTDAPTKSHSCSGIDQTSCSGTCSWSTGSETASCSGFDQLTCSSKGCTWSS